EDAGEKLDESDTAPVLEKLDEVEALITLDGNPIDADDIDEAAVQSKIGELESLMQAMSVKLYEAAAKDMQEEQEKEGDDGVYEADFEVVDDDESTN
ncbi:MAG: hypothetical protein VYD21_02495, partial [Candidatus Thermoplasmatota archaeon]|nr:hypothetical protein [Candidatus Thermoplasmatota archaeon]